MCWGRGIIPGIQEHIKNKPVSYGPCQCVQFINLFGFSLGLLCRSHRNKTPFQTLQAFIPVFFAHPCGPRSHQQMLSQMGFLKGTEPCCWLLWTFMAVYIQSCLLMEKRTIDLLTSLLPFIHQSLIFAQYLKQFTCSDYSQNFILQETWNFVTVYH